MALELFSVEYNDLKKIVGDGSFDDPLKSVMKAMKNIFGVDGFDDSCHAQLDSLRGLLIQKEDEQILQSAGAEPSNTKAPDAAALNKAAAIKFLRHLYMTHERGSQKIWVFSSPSAYRHYPTGELDAVKANILSIKSRLNDKAEQFSSKQKAALGEATTTGLAWCQKTNMVLAAATTDAASDEMKIIKRWFADSNTSEEDLTALVAKLSAGFKKVTATINSNQLIFTDMASIRKATSGKAKDLYSAYAFVASGRHEKIPVVYIENAFFSKNSTPIPDKVLWAITVVHEITHLDVSTDDHQYDYDGLKPGTKVTCAEAAENADNWAYFCADCAGALSKSHVTSAMNGW
jgi:hypothetical protein